jgi:hypothetical protein
MSSSAQPISAAGNRSVSVEPDCPKFVVRRLAQFHSGHPIKNFTRIQVAKDPSLKLQKKWRVNRVTEIQQRVWDLPVD